MNFDDDLFDGMNYVYVSCLKMNEKNEIFLETFVIYF